MKQLYLECRMGASGDMLLAALADLTGAPDALVEQLNGLGLPGVTVTRETVCSHGISGTHIAVRLDGVEEDDAFAHLHEHGQHHDQHHGQHLGCGMAEIGALLGALPVSTLVKTEAFAIYQSIADAESSAHGKPVSEIHFHELGMLDAVVDIVGCCLALERIAPDAVACSVVSVGGGTVQTAHGVLPVPAPATAALLVNMPVAGGPVESELTTPTGAAILKFFVKSFSDVPEMRIERTAYGMGSRTFDRPNCLRAFLGETGEGAQKPDAVSERVAELACNLDDMTGEALAFAMETLLENGALDAFCTPISMKKGRPGQQLTVLCKERDADRLAQCMLLHTTTLGVRKHISERYTLSRGVRTADTPYGPIRIKTATGEGISREKPEYDDVAAAARKHGVPLSAILEELHK